MQARTPRHARAPRHARHRSPRALDPRMLPTPSPAPILERRPPTPPTGHPYKTRFFLGPFFQRNRKPVMMRTQATLKKFFQRLGKSVMMRTRTTQKFSCWAVFSASSKTRHDARASYSQTHSGVFSADSETRHDAQASYSQEFFQRVRKSVMMRARTTQRWLRIHRIPAMLGMRGRSPKTDVARATVRRP